VRVAYFDCPSGASGDMLLGALVDAGAPLDAIAAALAGLPVSGYRLEQRPVQRAGIAATKVDVPLEPGEQPHRSLSTILGLIRDSGLPEDDIASGTAVFSALAEAEAKVHGVEIEAIEFHEVGAVDAIVDVLGVVVALRLLGVEACYVSPLPAGAGTARTAHGEIPVPGPATLEILEGLPVRFEGVGELTTPTGAAILMTVVQEWIDQPVMTVERIGHGAGRREFVEQPNLLRLFVGTTADSPERDQVWVLETNLDDLPAEVIGYCYDLLLAAGALDVFSTPVFMKKNRPGVLLSVLAPESVLPTLEAILFRETMTFGIRRYPVTRSKLRRQACTVQTPWGPVQGKLGWRGDQPPVFTPEYEDCARVARAHGVALREVFAQAQRAYMGSTVPS